MKKNKKKKKNEKFQMCFVPCVYLANAPRDDGVAV